MTRKTKITSKNYQTWMAHLQSLPMVAIVTTGRTGSDFLQSLIDSHPQIATFNGHFLVYSEFFLSAVTFSVDEPSISDVADEFIGRYIYKLVSRYDIQEAKDCLGCDSKQSFDLNTFEFKYHLMGLMDGIQINSRNFLLAVYGAYQLCLGQNIEELLVIVHHPHLDHEFRLFLKDFPSARVVFTARDPRANFFSLVDNFKSYNQANDNQAHIYTCLKMVLQESEIADEFNLQYTTTRLEDLPREDVIRELALWLGVEYRESMLRSTWAGLDWHGDRVSKKKFSAVGWSKNRTQNGWQHGLGWIEKYVFNYIMNARLRSYGYEVQSINLVSTIFVGVLILLPFKCERRFMSLSYVYSTLKKGDRQAWVNLFLTMPYFIRRINICYRYYWHSLTCKPYSRNWLRGANNFS
jgi:hypothetical protein